MLFGSCLFQSVTRVVTQSVPLFLSQSLSSSVSLSLPQSVSPFISASVSQSFSQSVTPSVPLSLSQSFSTYFVCLSVSHSLPPSLPTSHLHSLPPPIALSQFTQVRSQNLPPGLARFLLQQTILQGCHHVCSHPAS